MSKQNHLKTILLTCFVLLLCAMSYGQQAKIQGKITDVDGPIWGAKVMLLNAGIVINGCLSDDEGQYSMIDIEPGTYSLSIVYYDTKTVIEQVTVVANRIEHIDVDVIYPHICPWPEPMPERPLEAFDHLESTGHNFSRDYIRETQR